MLTTNFINTLFLLGGASTAKDVNNEDVMMYNINPYSSDSTGRDITYNVDETTALFTKESASTELNVDTQNYSGTRKNAFYIISNGYTKNTLSLLVGTGNTAATKDDYKLVSQVELESGVDSATMDAEHGMLRVVREFINNTGSNVIITEVGMYNVSISKSSSSAWTVHTFLIGREVLSESVTIEPGKSCTFTFTVDMNSVAGTT